MAVFSLLRAQAFAARLVVDVSSAQVCHACLCLVSIPLAGGDAEEALRWARTLTPDLWHEGLRDYALATVQAARDAGARGAAAALTDLELNAGHGATALALVLRLAEDQVRRTRTEMRLESAARPRLALATPELN